MFLLFEEMPGKGVKIMVLPVHHCWWCQSFGNMRRWIRQTQNCIGGSEKAAAALRRWYLSTPLWVWVAAGALGFPHTPGDRARGQLQGYCKVMEPAFLRVTFCCTL